MNEENLSLIEVSYILRPSACKRMCRGIVKPLAFCQFEIHGGTFQSYMSLFVSLRGGLLIIVGGGDPWGLGILLCLNLGGSKGSS